MSKLSNVIIGPWKRSFFDQFKGVKITSNNLGQVLVLSIVFCLFSFIMVTILFSMFFTWPLAKIVEKFPTKPYEAPPVITPEILALLNKNVIQLRAKKRFWFD